MFTSVFGPFGALFFILPMVLLAAVFIVLMIVVVVVRGRREPDPQGRRAEAAYLFSGVFALGVLGLVALAFVGRAIGAGASGSGGCGPFTDVRQRVRPAPGMTIQPFPEFSLEPLPGIEIPNFQFTIEPVPAPTFSPATSQIRPQPQVCRVPGRIAVANGVRAGIHLGAAALGVVWFGNRARELLAKETSK